MQTLILNEAGKTIKIHAIPTGTVAVKKAHRNPSLGLPAILLDPRWTAPMPIYTWVIEHPEGVLVIDTGENVQVLNKNYFDCDPTTGWVTQKMLRFEIEECLEIGHQLQTIGIQPTDVRWVALTHLHLDHVDGLYHFPKSEIFISKREWEHPYGVVSCLLPKWLKPNLIDYNKNFIEVFPKAFSITRAEDIWLVPTPGHTHGHQSVILFTKEYHILFAGDISFSDKQLLGNQIAGICVDKKAAKKTYQNIINYCKNQPTIYLPTHDAQSGKRLRERIFL